MRRVKKITERKRARMSQIRFGRPSVRWFSRDGGLSAEERMADGGRPGVGGAMKAELFAVRRCMSGEESDFDGGNNSGGGGLGEGEEDMTAVASSRKGRATPRDVPEFRVPARRRLLSLLVSNDHGHAAS